MVNMPNHQAGSLRMHRHRNRARNLEAEGKGKDNESFQSFLMTYKEKKPVYEGHSLINFIIHLVMKEGERSKHFNEAAHGFL